MSFATIEYELAHGRVAVVDQVVEDWRRKLDDSDVVTAIDIIVDEAIEVAEKIKRLAENCGQGVRPNTDRQALVRAHVAGRLLEEASGLISKAIASAEKASDLGYVAKGRDALAEVQRDLNDLKCRFAKRWMLPAKERVQQAKQDLIEGRFEILTGDSSGL